MDLIAALLFLLPAGAANVAPVLAARAFPTWDFPVDFGWTVRGERLFGSHKTWRGLFFGVMAASAVFAIEHLFVPAAYISFADSWFAGGLIGLAALTGDLIKSAVKRQLGIAPGRAWFPFDQVDWLIGAIMLLWPFLHLSLSLALQILFLGFFLHLAAHYAGYFLGLNRTPV